MAIAALISALAACAPAVRPVVTPIPMRIHGNAATAQHIYILLPGVRDDLDSFQRKGFIDIARGKSRGRERAAFVAVDAHLGYYRDKSVQRRILKEVVGQFPGKRLTLVGISLGGLGALATARRNPALFDQVVLIAPFLGRPELIKRIRRWTGPPPTNGFDKEIVAIWRWLSNGAAGMRITLLYGRGDRFRADYEALAERTLAVSFHNIEGGHNWRTWNALWRQWLTRTAGKRAAVP